MSTAKKVVIGLAITAAVVAAVAVILILLTPPPQVISKSWAGPFSSGASCGGCGFDAVGLGALGATIIPKYTGDVTVQFSGTVMSGGPGTMEFLGWMGTGAAPVTGVQLQSPNLANSSNASGASAYQLINITAANTAYSFKVSFELKGLTKGVPVWLDAAIKSKTGWNGVVTNVSFSASEASCLIC